MRMKSCKNLLAQFKKTVGIEKLLKEKVAFVIDSTAEFFGVIFGVVGDAEFFYLGIHSKSFDSFTSALSSGLQNFYISTWLEISGRF